MSPKQNMIATAAMQGSHDGYGGMAAVINRFLDAYPMQELFSLLDPHTMRAYFSLLDKYIHHGCRAPISMMAALPLYL
jgi:hypothetical protein